LELLAPTVALLRILTDWQSRALAVWVVASLSLFLVTVLLWRLTVIAFHIRPAVR